MKQLRDRLEEEKHEWTRRSTKDIFDKGLREMTSEEVQARSIEWLRDVQQPTYMEKLRGKPSGAYRALSSNLSPADHINLILLLLPDNY